MKRKRVGVEIWNGGLSGGRERLTTAKVFACARDVSIGGTYRILIVGFTVSSVPATALDSIHNIAVPPRAKREPETVKSCVNVFTQDRNILRLNPRA